MLLTAVEANGRSDYDLSIPAAQDAPDFVGLL